MNNRKLLIPLVLVAAILISTAVIHPARAAGDTLYFSPSNVPAPATFPTNVVFNLTADTLGTGPSSGINGWDIIVTDNDPGAANLNPLSVSIAGNLLAPFGTISELINCVNGGAWGGVGSPGGLCRPHDGRA